MLEINHLCAGFGRKPVLKDISFRLRPHKLTAVIGKNGCGKSTLCSCISQQVRYTGEILLGGRNLALMTPGERARTVSVLPQILKSPHVTVEELVLFGREPYLDFGKRPQKSDREAVARAISALELDRFSGRFIDGLSGGERQRAYLAMVLAQETRLIVLDEPTTYLDLTYETSFLNFLADLKAKHKKTLLVVMHNLSQAVRYADDLVVIDSGAVCYAGSVEECLEQNIIEAVFGVEKHVFYEDEKRFVLFSS